MDNDGDASCPPININELNINNQPSTSMVIACEQTDGPNDNGEKASMSTINTCTKDSHRRNSRKRIREDSMSSTSDSYESLLDASIESPSSQPTPQQAHLRDWLSNFNSWSNADRMIALESLVTNERLCDIQSIRFLLSIIEPLLQRDFISLLPKELALYVLSFLDPSDLLRAAQTCRYWRILCEDNLLWREKCREEGLLEDHETVVDLFRKRTSRSRMDSRLHFASFDYSTNLVNPMMENEESLPQASTSSTDCPSTSYSPMASPPAASHQTPGTMTDSSSPLPESPDKLFIPSEYKLGFLRQKSIECNWRFGVFPSAPDLPSSVGPTTPSTPNVASKKSRSLRPILQLKGHDDHVITCLQFNPTSNLIVSGSDDNTLKVWSSTSGKCLRTLVGHTGGVWSSQLSPSDIVISGSTDRTLKVWNAISGECLHTFYGHTSTVRCMALHENYVVSGSRDATLRVWDITSGECCHVLTGHVGAVRCVQFNGKIVVSGAYDFLVKVWDVASESCLHTLEGHTNRVYSLQFDGENIVSGSLDTSIRVWSASGGNLRHTLLGHESLTSGMQLRGNILVSGNADSTVKVWDITTGQCLSTLAGSHKHRSAVTCLQFNAKFVVTSSDDGTVKLWDLKSGEFIRNLVTLPSGGSGGVVWRIRSSNTRLVCAVGSRNGTEETKLLVLDFDSDQTENMDRPIRRWRGPFNPHRFASCRKSSFFSIPFVDGDEEMVGDGEVEGASGGDNFQVTVDDDDDDIIIEPDDEDIEECVVSD